MTLKKICMQARKAAEEIATAPSELKNQALHEMAKGLIQEQASILKANARDVRAAKAAKISPAMIDRLLLDQARLEKMVQSLEEVAGLSDPVGKVVASWTRPNGLKIEKVRIPIGVIGMIYEARPNVTVEAASLCVKSGNAVILRGGSEAFHSNKALANVLAQGLKKASLNPHCVQVLPTTDRKAVNELLKMEAWIDLIIPRGGESLIKNVVKHSRIPVIKHYKGVCHLYLDETADPKMAEEICLNAKVQRPGVCNAIETLLVHRSLQNTLLPKLITALQKHGVEVRGGKEIMQVDQGVKAAKASDFGTEFLDLILPIKLVDNLDEAIEHIKRYGSQHTESIVTRNTENAERFVSQLHSSVVLTNASTRFADGGELGMGAEIGISTTKLHAFGPMGLEDLTIPRFVVRGHGQIR